MPFAVIVFFLLCAAGWLAHVIKCIAEWTPEYLIFLVVGACMAPIGIVHGWFVMLAALF